MDSRYTPADKMRVPGAAFETTRKAKTTAIETEEVETSAFTSAQQKKNKQQEPKGSPSRTTSPRQTCAQVMDKTASISDASFNALVKRLLDILQPGTVPTTDTRLNFLRQNFPATKFSGQKLPGDKISRSKIP